MCVSLVGAQPSTETASGYLDGALTSVSHPFQFNAGDTVLIMTEVTSGDLDTVLKLFAQPDSETVLAENDDYNSNTYNSALVYHIVESGEYIITVEPYEVGETFGDYTVNVTIGDESLFDYLNSISRVELSGTPRIMETEHFVIHYTLEGVDDTTDGYAEMLSKVLEQVWAIQIEEMGWPAPPSDTEQDDDPRYDVYIASLKKNDDVTMGYAQAEYLVGDNPNTALEEKYAGTSYLVVENDFVETMDDTRSNETVLLRATTAHEFHHAIQMGYDFSETHGWYGEATAVWMETATFAEAQDATIYVGYNYDYPEICFGTEDDSTDGMLQYGEWMFIQSLVDAFDEKIVPDLWDNIALYEEFEPLEQTLSAHGETIPQALVRYRVQNLARDYDLAPQFDATLWLEEIIRNPGEWSHTGEGVQELGANYFWLKQPSGTYQIKLSDKSQALELWAIGVNGDGVDAIPLGNEGLVDTHDYDYTYLMVFNPTYDNDVNDCTYYTYSLSVNGADSSAATSSRPIYSFNASNFEPLTLVE